MGVFTKEREGHDSRGTHGYSLMESCPICEAEDEDQRSDQEGHDHVTKQHAVMDISSVFDDSGMTSASELIAQNHHQVAVL